GIVEAVRESVQNAVHMLEVVDATWEEVSLPHVAYADATYDAIAYSEAASSVARYDGVRYGHRAEGSDDVIDMYNCTRTEGFGDEVKRRLLVGTAFLSGDLNEALFRKAQKVRSLMKRDFEAAFEKFDLIVGPTTATAAPKLGEDVSSAASD